MPDRPATTGDTTMATVTDDEIVARAAGLYDLIRARQDEAESLGRYTEDVHDAFVDAGFYHLLTPKRFGGLEVSIKTFIRVVIQLARADPGTAWCYCLGHAHNLTTVAQ